MKGERDTDGLKLIKDCLGYLYNEEDSSTWSRDEWLDKIVINRVHRYGKYNPDRHHPIIINWQCYPDKQHILRNRRCLPDGIYVDDDFPVEIIECRNILRPILKLGLQKEHYCGNIRMNYDKLVVNGKSYGVQDLSSLPRDLDPRSTCELANMEIIAFFGQFNPFSNFHPAKSKVNGTIFNCSEQYIQYKKAEHYNDDTTGSKIMQTKSPKEMKYLGGRINGYIHQEWECDMAKTWCYCSDIEVWLESQYS